MVEILAAITPDLQALGEFLFTVVYIMGAFFTVSGLLGLATASATIKGVGQGVPTGGLIFSIFVGIAMMAFHDWLDIGAQTIFRQDSRQMLDFEPRGGAGASASFNAILAFTYNALWVLGMFSAVRGFLIWANMHKSSGQPGQGFSDGLTFFSVGILLMNFDLTVRVAAATVAQGGASGQQLSETILTFIPAT